MADKDDILEALRQVMHESVKHIQNAQARSQAQHDQGIILDRGLMGDGTMRILEIADMLSVIEAMRHLSEKTPLAQRLSPSRMHFSIMVSVLAGSLVIHFVRNSNMTPDGFERQLPLLTEMISDLFAINYAERERVRQEQPRPDDED